MRVVVCKLLKPGEMWGILRRYIFSVHDMLHVTSLSMTMWPICPLHDLYVHNHVTDLSIAWFDHVTDLSTAWLLYVHDHVTDLWLVCPWSCDWPVHCMTCMSMIMWLICPLHDLYVHDHVTDLSTAWLICPLHVTYSVHNPELSKLILVNGICIPNRTEISPCNKWHLFDISPPRVSSLTGFPPLVSFTEGYNLLKEANGWRKYIAPTQMPVAREHCSHECLQGPYRPGGRDIHCLGVPGTPRRPKHGIPMNRAGNAREYHYSQLESQWFKSFWCNPIRIQDKIIPSFLDLHYFKASFSGQRRSDMQGVWSLGMELRCTRFQWAQLWLRPPMSDLLWNFSTSVRALGAELCHTRLQWAGLWLRCSCQESRAIVSRACPVNSALLISNY